MRQRAEHRVHVIAALFVTVALIAFGRSLHAPFDFDDGPAISQNRSIRALWPLAGPLSPPGHGTAVSGRPIANLSFALNYQVDRVFGIAHDSTGAPVDTVGFHTTSILLHVAAALLLFGVVRRTLLVGRLTVDWHASADRLAAIVAGLWLIHPIQTEAVDYLSQRTEVLVTVFYLATFYLAIRGWASETCVDGQAAPPRSGRWWLLGSVLTCALGMGTKEVMLTAPFALLLYDRAFVSPSWRAIWQRGDRRAYYLALGATIGISVALVLHGARAGTVGLGLGETWYEYLYSQAWAVTRYIRLIAWPDRLTYDYGEDPVRGLAGVPGMLTLVVIGVLTFLAWRRDRWRWAGFLGAFFLLVLAPSSSVIPIRTEVAAERRVYLASAAVFVLVVVAAEAAWQRAMARPRTRARYRLAGGLVGIALAAALIAGTSRRSAMYADPALLWRDALANRPSNGRAANGVGAIEMHAATPRLTEADSFLQRAVLLDSTLTQARVNRAVIAIHEAHLADAESLLVHALAIDPGDSAATDLLSRVLLARDLPDRAIAYLEPLARAFPSSAAFRNLGVAFLVTGRLDSAVVLLRHAVTLDSNDVEALRALGGALIENDRGVEALPVLERVVHVEPRSAAALAMLGLASAEASRPSDAEAFATAAVGMDSTDVDVCLFAGRALQRAGHLPQAEETFSRAARLDPGDPRAPTRLAVLLARLGRSDDAMRLLDDVTRRIPSYGPAQAALNNLRASSASRR